MNEKPPPVKTKPGEQFGLVCPTCACKHFDVVYTRRAAGGKILRRRECRHCGRRITTSETRLG